MGGYWVFGSSIGTHNSAKKLHKKKGKRRERKKYYTPLRVSEMGDLEKKRCREK